MSTDGRQLREVVLWLMKRCRKLGIPFFVYLGDRFGLSALAERFPFLPELMVGQSACASRPGELPQLLV